MVPHTTFSVSPIKSGELRRLLWYLLVTLQPTPFSHLQLARQPLNLISSHPCLHPTIFGSRCRSVRKYRFPLRNFDAHSLLGYLTVFVSDTRGSNVQVYSDIDDSWTGQSDRTVLRFEESGGTSVFTLSAKDAFTYSQNSNDMALWGDVIFASRSSSSSKLTVSSGSNSTTRGQFVDQGTLSEVNATTNATINSQSWTPEAVVGLSHDLGDVSSETSVTFAVGYVRDNAINYLGRSYTGIRTLYFPRFCK